MLMLPATADVVEGWIRESEAAPEELTTIATVMKAPPMPMIPTEHHGKLLVMGFLVYAGATEPGLRAVAPFRALATPVADMIRPMKYPEMFPPDQGFHPVVAVRTVFVDGVDRAVAETMIDRVRNSTAMMAAVQLRVLGGAAARVPADATAYAHRSKRIMANAAAMFTQPEQAAEQNAWVSGLVADMHVPDTCAYVNFIGAEGPARIHDAYPPATWKRLVDIKRRYDPANLFRSNQNITPGA
jgi:hypothetical protein